MVEYHGAAKQCQCDEFLFESPDEANKFVEKFDMDIFVKEGEGSCLWYIEKVEKKDYWLCCNIYRATQWFSEKEPARLGLFCYFCLKWDGCCNYNFYTEGVMFHTCNEKGINDLSLVFSRIWSYCGKRIPRFDFS